MLEAHTYPPGLVIAVVDAAGALLNISLLTVSDTLTLNRYYCCPFCSPDTTPELGGTRCESHCSQDYLSPPTMHYLHSLYCSVQCSSPPQIHWEESKWLSLLWQHLLILVPATFVPYNVLNKQQLLVHCVFLYLLLVISSLLISNSCFCSSNALRLSI